MIKSYFLEESLFKFSPELHGEQFLKALHHYRY